MVKEKNSPLRYFMLEESFIDLLKEGISDHKGFWIFISTFLSFLMMISLWLLLYSQRVKKKDSGVRIGVRFQVKIASIFSLFVLLPCLIASGFSFLFVQKILNTWFHNQVQIAVEDSRYVAEGYVQEHERGMRYILLNMVQSLENNLKTKTWRKAKDFDKEIEALKEQLHECEKNYGVHGMLFVVEKGAENRSFFSLPVQKKVIALSPYAVILNLDPLWDGALLHAQQEGVYTQLDQSGARLWALSPIKTLPLFSKDSLKGLYLMIGRPLDGAILDKIAHATKASKAYQDLLGKQKELATRFVIIFAFLVIGLLLLAMIAGLVVSRQIIFPVSALIHGAEDVRRGVFSPLNESDIPATHDLRNLMRTFNAMIEEMTDKKRALERVNARLNERTILVEGVLEGISAGVFSTDRQGLILVDNVRARNILCVRHPLEGHFLRDWAEELVPLFSQALEDSPDTRSADIPIKRLGRSFVLRVNIKSSPYNEQVIITFEDISHIISAQKKLAWQDVAQRVAHEVKNPLTPIILSAERLRRRFLRNITDEPAIFQDCVETIIRHVKLIGNLIAEFAAFARLPTPHFQKVNLGERILSIATFQRQAYSQVEFVVRVEDIFIQCDSQQIEQVIVNLIKNALESIEEKFENGTGGCIQLILSEAGNEVELRVIDNGVGLTEAKEIGDLVSTKIQGMGLGLTIVQKIIDDHQGSFTLKGNLLEPGVCACVVLPKNQNLAS